MPPAQLNLLQIYRRALAMLAPEKHLAFALALAGVVVAALQLAEPILFGRVVDALSKGENAFGLIGLWAALGFVSILAGVVVAVYADRLAHRQKLVQMADVFDRAIALPQRAHAARGSGVVIRTILSGSSSLFWLWLGAMRDQLTAVFGILLMIPAALALDARMTLILMALAAAYTAINVLVMRKTSAGQSAVETYESELSGRVVDVIGNVTVVQAYNRLAAEGEALRTLMSALLKAQYPVLTWWGVAAVLHKASGTVAMVAILVAGAILSRQGDLTVGEIVSFVAFAGLLIGKLEQLSGFVVRVHQQAPVLRSLFALMDQSVEVADKPNARPLSAVRGDVGFDDVGFRYDAGPQGVYGLAFRAAAGETVALVGPTGSGKSTTIALLQRFIAPQSGRITIDGCDIADAALQSLRDAIAVVFQDAGLFNRSIGENIRIGKPDASEAEVEHAARLAQAHEFIMAKADGYQHAIGERGASLSGGERQRLAIARAILKDAPILILDEATSALDTETEAKIKRALDALRKGRTTFIIAHRLSTVADADQILVLDDGRIVERGTFADLTALGGLFARLVAEGGFTIPKSTEQANASPQLPAERETKVEDYSASG